MLRSLRAGPRCWSRRRQTVSATAKGGRVATFVCDVSKADQIQQTYDAVIKAFGKVDILINNAGQSMCDAGGTDHRRDLAATISS